MSKFLSIVYPISTSLMPPIYSICGVICGVNLFFIFLGQIRLQLFLSIRYKCFFPRTYHIYLPEHQMQDFRIHHTAFLLNHADKRQITVSDSFSPLSSSSPSVPYTSYRHSRILPRSVTNRKAGFTYFFLASIIYLLYIRTVSPPRRVFESPTRYQFSSISIRTGIHTSLTFTSKQSPQCSPP